MNENFWKSKRVLVTGGQGFLGTHLVDKLQMLQPKSLLFPSHHQADLMTSSVRKQILKNIDVVIHLAALVGGIGFNQRHPGRIFYENLIMGVETLHQAMLCGVKKFVAVGTVCAYPKFTPTPFSEENLWGGYPEETNAPYGLAKKMLLVQAQAYRTEYGFNSIYLLPANLYGPGDNFDPKSSHVVPALIRKFTSAKQNKARSVTVWGSGTPTREFLYVEDAAEAIILATEKYNGAEPVNLGSGFEISIRELAETIQEIVGFKGEIIWDKTKPDGQPRRKINTSRAKAYFDFQATTNFSTGLRKTIGWYYKNLSRS